MATNPIRLTGKNFKQGKRYQPQKVIESGKLRVFAIPRQNFSFFKIALTGRDMISIKISVHVRPAIWMKCIPVCGRNRAKRYFQALLTEFPAFSHRSVKEWANKHPAKAQLAHGR
ncbi:hypothetical protein STAS_27854 [Striga asiatica]|uniref:Uncharacterized protein n=1 Tax=Striga asiatica TaxID=4170 RepID=A0A5A7QYR7_STRAF|nr:hypothetical protein STAS_27854 [Striga asiatica]